MRTAILDFLATHPKIIDLSATLGQNNEWAMISWKYKTKLLDGKPMKRRYICCTIYLDDFKASYYVFDFLVASFEYADPAFPDNLLARIG